MGISDDPASPCDSGRDHRSKERSAMKHQRLLSGILGVVLCLVLGQTTRADAIPSWQGAGIQVQAAGQTQSQTGSTAHGNVWGNPPLTGYNPNVPGSPQLNGEIH